MRREMIHIARYLFLGKDELGVGDIIARRIPQAAPFLRLWDTFQIISRRRHRQALRRGTGPKDVSFLISIIVRVGPHFRLLLPTSGQARNSRKIHSKIPRRYAHDTHDVPRRYAKCSVPEATDIIPVVAPGVSNARCCDLWASWARDQRPTQLTRPVVCAEPPPAFPRPPLRTFSSSPS